MTKKNPPRKITQSDVDEAIAMQALEGLTVTEETAADLAALAEGKLTPEECRARILQRHGGGETEPPERPVQPVREQC